MLDETEDIDERKKIRDRLRQVQFVIKAQREEQRKKREDEREQRIRDRLKEADLKKQQTLQMYNDMAKKGPTDTRPSVDNPEEKKRDLVEEAIRDRVRAADNRKKRIMAAFDHAATSQPAGQARIVEFDSFKSADVSKLQTNKPVIKGSCTFGMSGGVPQVTKPPVVKAPQSPAPDDSHLDPMERAIRARVREAEERKRRTLAAYDMAARSGGAGPKTFILQEYRDLDVNEQQKPKPRYDPCFRGGLKT
ncbi:smoothelin domain-containing protein [Caerostris darwini]|uniref:Smoothelin domain-containing protein n=1 Tax=Caerostris darwini TaxID=1538125 RepID=A0AAV4QUJ3_9ARAC|nr:smoothelin domain-containing protein [Caerostris darwini]